MHTIKTRATITLLANDGREFLQTLLERLEVAPVEKRDALDALALPIFDPAS